MARSSHTIDVYLEIGEKRTFAGPIDWPGWCRTGGDEGAALQALVDSGPRYAKILHAARISFKAPADSSTFAVVERLEGNTTTDFGAPDVAPSSDAQPVDDAELERFQKLLKAYWKAFDRAVSAASGKELRKGPRGGGRELEAIIRHVMGAEAGYLARLAWKHKQEEISGPKRRTRPHSTGGPRRVGGGGTRRATQARATRGRDLDAALLRPPPGLACARSSVGDRGSRHVVLRRVMCDQPSRNTQHATRFTFHVSRSK